MATVNKRPVQLKIDDNNYDRFLNQMQFTGIDDRTNALTVSQTSFIDSNNVYVNEDKVLCSRPPLTRYFELDENIDDYFDFVTHYLVYTDNKTNVRLVDKQTLQEVSTSKFVSDSRVIHKLIGRKIFLFTNVGLRYLDLDADVLQFIDATPYIFVPETEVYVNGIVTKNHNLSNIMSPNSKRAYNYNRGNSINVNDLIGTTVTYTDANGNEVNYTITDKYSLLQLMFPLYNGDVGTYTDVISNDNYMYIFANENKVPVLYTDTYTNISDILDADSSHGLYGVTSWDINTKSITTTADTNERKAFNLLTAPVTVSNTINTIKMYYDGRLRNLKTPFDGSAMFLFARMNSVNGFIMGYKNGSVVTIVQYNPIDDTYSTLVTTNSPTAIGGAYIDENSYTLVSSVMNDGSSVVTINLYIDGENKSYNIGSAIPNNVVSANVQMIKDISDYFLVVTAKTDSTNIAAKNYVYAVTYSGSLTSTDKFWRAGAFLNAFPTKNTLKAVFDMQITSNSTAAIDCSISLNSYYLAGSNLYAVTSTRSGSEATFESNTTEFPITATITNESIVSDNNYIVTNYGILEDNNFFPYTTPTEVDYSSYNAYLMGIREGVIVSDVPINLTVFLETIPNEEYIENFVPNIIVEQKDIHLSLLNMACNTTDTVNENNEFMWYIKHKNVTYLDYDINQMFLISQDEILAFDTIGAFIIYSDTQDATGDNEYKYVRSKLPVTLKQGTECCISTDGNTIFVPMSLGLAAMTREQFLQSNEQGLNYITTPIDKHYQRMFTNAIKCVMVKYWLVCWNKVDKTILLFDLRDNSWWQWTSPTTIVTLKDLEDRVTTSFENKVTRFLQTNERYVYSAIDGETLTNDNLVWYKDYEGSIISWFMQSQRLHFDAINNYKQIKNLTFNSQALDGITPLNCKLTLTTYKDRVLSRTMQEISYDIDQLRTYVRNVNMYQITALQYKLESNDKIAFQTPVNLTDVTIKYRLQGGVR